MSNSTMNGIISKGKESAPPPTKLSKARRKDDVIRNPCVKESHKSIDCIAMNEDTRQCHLYIENYKSCVKFWNQVSKQRQKAGIKPHLPPPEEREHIRQEFFDKMGKT